MNETALRAAAALTVMMAVAACALATPATTSPPSADGLWEGEVRASTAGLPLRVAMNRDSSGWSATVDVPTQYALSYPLSDVRVDGGTVEFRFPDLLPPASFEGTLERGRISGIFTSARGADTIRGTLELWRRPAVDVPYASEPVRFRNGDVELAGTVLRPQSGEPLPAMLLVHGSGPQTRVSYLRWFADRFARAGFVVLLYDKRGAGESGGEPWPRTVGSFADLAGDAVAGAKFLAAEPYVDSQQIGIWGLSQGAWIGPLAATLAPDLFARVIMISGGGVSPAEQELYDDEVKLRDLGFAPAEIDEAVAYLRLADDYVRSGSDEAWERFAATRAEVRSRPWYAHLDRFPQVLPREAPPWIGLRADLDYDPAPVLASLSVPMLLVLGIEDRLTPARETAHRVERALIGGGNRGLTVQLVPGADHTLLVKPAPDAPWVAERPAENWVVRMIQWARAGAQTR